MKLHYQSGLQTAVRWKALTSSPTPSTSRESDHSEEEDSRHRFLHPQQRCVIPDSTSSPEPRRLIANLSDFNTPFRPMTSTAESTNIAATPFELVSGSSDVTGEGRCLLFAEVVLTLLLIIGRLTLVSIHLGALHHSTGLLCSDCEAFSTKAARRRKVRISSPLIYLLVILSAVQQAMVSLQLLCH